MRIEKDNTTALIVDVQEKLFPHIHEHEKLEENLNILIKGLNYLELPLYYSEQYKKGLGETIPSLRQLLGDKGFEKIAFSCCDEQSIMNEIRKCGKNNIILAGIETHICILQTVLDLISKGFVPVIIADCTGSRKPDDAQIALERMKQAGAIVSSYESILFELCKVAGNDTFKAISKLVK